MKKSVCNYQNIYQLLVSDIYGKNNVFALHRTLFTAKLDEIKSLFQIIIHEIRFSNTYAIQNLVQFDIFPVLLKVFQNEKFSRLKKGGTGVMQFNFIQI